VPQQVERVASSAAIPSDQAVDGILSVFFHAIINDVFYVCLMKKGWKAWASSLCEPLRHTAELRREVRQRHKVDVTALVSKISRGAVLT
jgi:hypothetical protein